MRTFTLAYCSRSKIVLDFKDVKEIASVASQNNKALDISGCLLYADNYFFQILEGSQENINELYLKISRDERHGQLRLLFYDQIEQRSFSDWNMGLIQTADTRELIDKYFEDKFVPSTLSPGKTTELIKDIKDIFCE